MSMKNSNDTMWNRNSDLPIWSALPKENPEYGKIKNQFKELTNPEMALRINL
jgi:hypothetical protein